MALGHTAKRVYEMLEDPKTWWTAHSKREQNRRKQDLAYELEIQGMDIPDSEYGWAHAVSEAEYT